MPSDLPLEVRAQHQGVIFGPAASHFLGPIITARSSGVAITLLKRRTALVDIFFSTVVEISAQESRSARSPPNCFTTTVRLGEIAGSPPRFLIGMGCWTSAHVEMEVLDPVIVAEATGLPSSGGAGSRHKKCHARRIVAKGIQQPTKNFFLRRTRMDTQIARRGASPRWLFRPSQEPTTPP